MPSTQSTTPLPAAAQARETPNPHPRPGQPLIAELVTGPAQNSGTWHGSAAPIEPHYAMSAPIAISRTAPIAIAARRPRPEQSIETPNSHSQSQSHTNGRAHLSASMSSTASEAGTNIRSRKDRPCDACRRRKSRCVINEGQTSCVLCQFHTQDCTFVQSPQPRKRKLNTEGKEESSAKRR